MEFTFNHSVIHYSGLEMAAIIYGLVITVVCIKSGPTMPNKVKLGLLSIGCLVQGVSLLTSIGGLK